jgi:hypothetical protein
MTPAALALVAQFESAAKATRAAEEELRKKLTEQIAGVERQRAFAFRRSRLIRSLAAAVDTDAAKPEAKHEDEAELEAKVWSQQRLAVREELGWTGESQSYDAILAQLGPLGSAVWQCARTDRPDAGTVVQDELEKFEAWFEGAHGKSFYALFDQYVPEVPVVDF